MRKLRKYSADDYRGRGYPVVRGTKAAWLNEAARERDVKDMPRWMGAAL